MEGVAKSHLAHSPDRSQDFPTPVWNAAGVVSERPITTRPWNGLHRHVSAQETKLAMDPLLTYYELRLCLRQPPFA